MGALGHFGAGNYTRRLDIVKKVFVRFFVWRFWPKWVNTPRKNFFWYLLTKMCWSFLWIIYIWNIRILWRRELCMKTWSRSKPLWILSIFVAWFFWPKMCNTPRPRIFLSLLYHFFLLSFSLRIHGRWQISAENDE